MWICLQLSASGFSNLRKILRCYFVLSIGGGLVWVKMSSVRPVCVFNALATNVLATKWQRPKKGSVSVDY